MRSAADRLHRALTTVVVVVAVGGAVALALAVAGGGPVAWVVGAVVGALVYLAVSARADRLVERLLHGRRPTPYRVLLEIAELTRAAAPGTELDRLPEAIGRHLGARTVQLTAHRPGLRDRVFRWRREDAGEADASVVFPIRHREDEVGVLAVDGEAVAGGSERRQLLADVADSLGAVLQAHRVEIELERQLRAAVAHGEQIATSRRAAVAEMDGERRAIERNLHDGAQHHLVSLRLALGLVEHQVGAGQLDAARDRLGHIVEQVDTAEAVLAETATGVSSATLAERGVVETLRLETAGTDSTVTVDSAGVPPGRRYGTDVEAAVYFCCLEAVNNARKHAPGAAVVITFAEVDGVLRFSVRDDGPGFAIDPSAAGPQRGMRNVATRITAVGGTVALDSAPGRGTTVAGSIPLADDDARTRPRTPTPPPARSPCPRRPRARAPRCAPDEAPGTSAFFDTVRDLLDGLEVPPPAAPRMREIVAELHAPPAPDAPRLPARPARPPRPRRPRGPRAPGHRRPGLVVAGALRRRARPAGGRPRDRGGRARRRAAPRRGGAARGRAGRRGTAHGRRRDVRRRPSRAGGRRGTRGPAPRRAGADRHVEGPRRAPRVVPRGARGRARPRWCLRGRARGHRPGDAPATSPCCASPPRSR